MADHAFVLHEVEHHIMNIFSDPQWGDFSNGLLKPCHDFLGQHPPDLKIINYNDDALAGKLTFSVSTEQERDEELNIIANNIGSGRRAIGPERYVALDPKGRATSTYDLFPDNFSIYTPEELTDLHFWARESNESKKIRAIPKGARYKYWGEQCETKPFKLQEVKLSGLIKGLYILIEPDEEESYLVSFKDAMRHPKLNTPSVAPRRTIFDLWYTWEAFINSGDVQSNRERLKYSGKIKYSKGPKTPLENTDLIGCYCGELISPRMISELNDLSTWNAKFVIRPNLKRISSMYFADLLRFSSVFFDVSKVIDSDDFTEEINENPEWWKECKALLPESKSEQIRYSLKLRKLMHKYRGSIESSFSFIHRRYSLYPRQDKLLTALERRSEIFGNTEKIGQVINDADEQELPYFLGSPYRRYNRACDRRLRKKYAEIFFNTLLKTILFLPLEELESHDQNHEIVQVLHDELKKQPPSEGGLLGMIARLSNFVRKNKIDLITKSLLNIFPKIRDDYLIELVESRNRMHHQPYDEDGFMASCRDFYPELIELMGRAFSDLEVVVPLSHQPNKNGWVIVAARMIMGVEDDFQINNIEMCDSESSQISRDYPCGELLLRRRSDNQTVNLSRFFKGEDRQRTHYDVGLLDRYTAGEATFQFIGEM
jgi:hypothetical protein